MSSRAPKIKVLHLITLSVVGGSQDNTFSTAELHDRQRYEVHLACNPDGQWVGRAKQAADVFHPLPSLITPIHLAKDLRALIEITRLLRREKFDLLHTHTAKAGFLGRLAGAVAHIPIVIHTYHAFPFHDFMPRWKRGLYLFLERLARPWTDYFITLSELDRHEAVRLKMAHANSSRVVYTGIDFAKLDQAAPPQQTRAKLGIPSDWQVVIMVGRLDPQKAPHLLIEAFVRVMDHHPRTLLLIVGEGELRLQVEHQIKALNVAANVRILGHRDDVPDLLQVADVFVFSSLWEAMGRAMIEAMLLGKPVVAPAVYGIPEVVLHGETGLLYDVGDTVGLAENLNYILEQPREGNRLGSNARALTRKLFHVQDMVSKIEILYEELSRTSTPSLFTPAAMLATSSRPQTQEGLPEMRLPPKTSS